MIPIPERHQVSAEPTGDGKIKVSGEKMAEIEELKERLATQGALIDMYSELLAKSNGLCVWLINKLKST